MLNDKYAAPAVTVVLCLGMSWNAALADVWKLRDGSAVVGEIQSEAKSEFEVMTCSGVRTIARADVESHEDRTSILRRLEPLTAQGNATPERQMSFARIAAEKGLFTDALDAADRAALNSVAVEYPEVLFEIPIAGVTKDGALTPESVAALILSQSDVVRRGRFVLASARLQELLRAHSSALPAPLVAALKKQLDSALPGVRAAVLRTIAITPIVELEGTLVDHILRDPDPDVRRSSAQVAAGMKSQLVNARLCKALESSQPALRAAAIDALEMVDDAHVVASLIKALANTSGGSAGARASMSVTNQVSFVYDFDVEVANAAAIADPQVSVVEEGIALDVTILGASERARSPAERARIGAVLDRLTGMSYGGDVARWNSWLASNRSAGATTTKDGGAR